MKKRSLLILLTLILLFTIASCGTNGAPANNSSPPADTGSSANTGSNAQNPPASSETDGEESPENPLADGTLVMATNAAFPPYEFYDEGEKIVGIDAEIAEAIAKKLGVTLVIDDMEFGSILSAVTSGKADMGMAGMTVTEERLQSVDFSTSYTTGVQVIIVREGSHITSVDDLFVEGANTSIGVQQVTTGDLYTTWDIEDEGLGIVNRFNKGADAVLALTTGKVDCVVIDNEPAKAFVAANPGLVILETEYAVEDYAIAFAKDSALTELVDNALRELIADGTVQAIIDKYIPAE